MKSLTEKILFGTVFVCIAGMGYVAFKPKAQAPVVAEAEAPKPQQKSPVDPRLVKFLNGEALANPQQMLSFAQPVSGIGGAISKLQGNYKGHLVSIENGEILNLNAQLVTQMTGQGAVTHFTGEMGNEQQGRAFQFLTVVKVLKGGAGKRDSTLLQVGPEAFIQLYYFPKSDSWVGNYYGRNQAGQLAHVGIARLERSQTKTVASNN